MTFSPTSPGGSTSPGTSAPSGRRVRVSGTPRDLAPPISGRRTRRDSEAASAPARSDHQPDHPSGHGHSRHRIGSHAEVLDTRRARRLASREAGLPAVEPVPNVQPAQPARPAPQPIQPATPPAQPASRAEARARRAAAAEDRPPLAAPVAPGREGAGVRPADSTVLQESIPVTAGTPADPITRGRRAARPQGGRRQAEVRIGRAVGNRRIWGGALGIALVLMVPGASILRAPSVMVADGDASVEALQDVEQAPATDAATTQPTGRATAAATAKAKAKVKARVKSSATGRKTAAAASRSRSAGALGISGARSGLPWASGLYMNGSSPANVSAFGAWRGRPVDVVVDWPQRSSWSDIENPDWLIRAWKGTPYTKSWGVAPIPEDGSSSLKACAAGSNNSHWRTFAQNMKDSGYSNQIVIRLGWEFNGDWYVWKATDPSDFAGCWRQIVGTVRAIAPDLRWDWNVNAGPGSSVTDAAKAYPGDDYVDIVGIDSYDQYPGVTSEANWQVHYSGPYGLKHWADFAKAHGKPFSVPEWGVYPARGSDGGGDNPLYVSKMLGFFRDNASNLAYEAYFNCAESYVKSAIFGTVQNPKAAAAYKAGLGG